MPLSMCAAVREALSDCEAGEMPQSQSLVHARHLARCVHCRSFVGALRSLADLVARPQPIPDQTRIEIRCRATSKAAARRGRTVHVLLAATAAALVAATTLAISYAQVSAAAAVWGPPHCGVLVHRSTVGANPESAADQVGASKRRAAHAEW